MGVTVARFDRIHRMLKCIASNKKATKFGHIVWFGLVCSVMLSVLKLGSCLHAVLANCSRMPWTFIAFIAVLRRHEIKMSDLKTFHAGRRFK